MSGKGSKRRPEDKGKIDANWDRIFNKPKPKTKDSKQSAKNGTIKP